MEQQKSRIYPLLGIFLAVFIIVFGLVRSRETDILYFLAGCYVLFAAVGCYRACLKVLPIAILLGAAFGGISYAATRDFATARAMAARIWAFCVAVIPGMSIRPVDLTGCLNQLKFPRAITLGFLIALNFAPLLGGEVRRIREAMRTRGAGSILHIKVFYRAFLIPLVTRLVNISDTLALSVETRGFTMENSGVTIYKKVRPHAADIVLFVLILGGAALTVIL